MRQDFSKIAGIDNHFEFGYNKYEFDFELFAEALL